MKTQEQIDAQIKDNTEALDAIERDRDDFCMMIAHTGGASMVLAASELTAMFMSIQALREILRAEDPASRDVCRDTLNIPDELLDRARVQIGGILDGIVTKYDRFGFTLAQLKNMDRRMIPGFSRWPSFRATSPQTAESKAATGDTHEGRRPAQGANSVHARGHEGQPADAGQQKPS